MSKKALLSFIAVCGIVITSVCFAWNTAFAYDSETITSISSACSRGVNTSTGTPVNWKAINSTTDYYVITGTVTATLGGISNRAFYMQDGTGGAFVFAASSMGVIPQNITYGDLVTVSGFVDFFNGSTELTWVATDNGSTTVSRVTSGNPQPEPQVITTTALGPSIDGNNGGESKESLLLRVNGLKVNALPWKQNAAINCSDLSGATTVYIYPYASNTSTPTGRFDIIGIGYQNDASKPYLDGYQIRPRMNQDIIDIPDGLVVSTSIASGKPVLIWGGVNDADVAKFNIYRSSSPDMNPAVLITQMLAPGTTFPDTSALQDTTYYYAIKSSQTAIIQQAQAESSYSNIAGWGAWGSPAMITTIAAATGANAGEIILNWISPGIDGNYIIQYSTYAVSWSTSAGQISISTSAVAPGTAVSTTLINLMAGVTHYIYIWIGDQYGLYSNISNGAAAQAMLYVPGAITFGTISQGTVQLLWTANGNPDGTLYEVWASTGTNQYGSSAAYIVNSTAPFTHPGLAPNTTYYYKVRANNAGLYSGYNAERSTHTLATTPGAITVGTVTGNSVQISWMDTNSAGTRYSVEASTGSNGAYGVIYAGNYAASITHSGLSANVTYYYKVRALNFDGISTAYNTETSTHTLASVPGAIVFVSVNLSNITVQWTDTVNSASTLYDLQASTNDNANYGSIFVGPNIPVTHLGLGEGSTHYYKVRAINLDGIYTAYDAEISTIIAREAPTYAVQPATSSVNIKVQYSEAVIGAANPANYSVKVASSPSDTLPINSAANVSGNIYNLIFTAPMAPNATYQMTISGVTDNFSNAVNVTLSTVNFVSFGGNTTPSVVFTVMPAEATDGSGFVTFTSSITDADLNSCMLKVEYSTSGLAGPWAKATISTLTATANDVGGPPLIDNGGAFQIGVTGGRQIVTNTVNPVTIVWISTADTQGIENVTANLRLTASDFTINSTSATSVGFALDNKAPVITGVPVFNSVNINSIDVTKPTVTESGTGISIWNIYTSTDDVTYTKSADFSNTLTSSTFAGLPANVTFYSRATFTDATGNVSALSAKVSTHTLSAVPGALTIGTVNASNIQVSWGSNGNSGSTLYDIYASTGTNGSYGKISTVNNTGPVVHAGLNSNTTYYYKVAARNQDGILTAYNTENSTFTLAVSPAGVTFSSVYVTSYTVDWSGETSGNPAATIYTIYLSTYADLSAPAKYQAVKSGNNMLFTGQLVNTTYYFGLTATNWAGIETAPSVLALNATLCQAPTNYAITAAAATSLTVAWPSDITQNPADSIYAVAVATSVDFTTITQALKLKSDNSGVVSGLTGNKLYFARLVAVNRVGALAVSPVIISTPTLAYSPVAFSSSAVSLSPASVQANWADGGNAPSTVYEVQLSTIGAGGAVFASSVAAQLSYNFTGLPLYATGYVQVRAQNFAGTWTSYVNLGSIFALNIIPPAAIASLAAVPGANSGDLAISWTSTGEDGNTGSAARYYVKYATFSVTSLGNDATYWYTSAAVYNQSWVPATAGTAESKTLSGNTLWADTTYYVVVIAEDMGGNKSPISAASIVSGLSKTTTAIKVARGWDGTHYNDNATAKPLSFGTTYQIRGTVTFVLQQSGSRIYIQDDSGSGILIYYAPGGLTQFATGYLVLARGYIDQDKGLVELIPTSTLNVKVLSTGNTNIEPATIQCKDLAASTVGTWYSDGGEIYEGKLVKIQNVTYSGAWIAGENKITFADITGSDNGGSRLYDNQPVDSDVISSTPTGKFDIIGVVRQYSALSPYSTGYGIMPRMHQDIIEVVDDLAVGAPELGKAKLFWTDLNSAYIERSGYAIYRSLSGLPGTYNLVTTLTGASLITNTTGAIVSYIDSIDPPSVQYSYYVQLTLTNTMNTAQNTGSPSNVATLPAGETQPTAITSLSAVPGSVKGQISLSWKAPYSNSPAGLGGSVARYIVEYASFNPASFGMIGPSGNVIGADACVYTYSQSITPANPGNTEMLTFTAPVGLGANTTFYFAVYSQNSSLLGSNVSNGPVSAVPKVSIVPGQITDLAAAIGIYKGQANLTWTARGNDGNIGTATKYIVRYATFSAELEVSTDTWWNRITDYTTAYFSWPPKVSGSAESQTILNMPLAPALQTPATFWFAIQTLDEYASSSPVSNIANTMVLPPYPNRPSQIMDLTAVTTTYGGGVVLMWSAPSDDPASISPKRPAVSYQVKYGTFSFADVSGNTTSWWNTATAYGQSWAPIAPGATENKLVINLTPNVTYYFAVRALDEYGNNAWDISTGTVTGTFAGAVPISLISSVRINDSNGVPLYNTQTFAVEGIVISTRGEVTSNGYFIQDQTGGLDAYRVVTTNYTIGDRIRVSGKLLHYNGLLELDQTNGTTGTDSLISSGNPLPNPQVVALSSFTDSTTGNNGGELLEGKLVRVNGVTGTGAFPAFNGNGSIVVTDASGSSTLYVYKNTNIDGTAAPIGKFDFIGVAAQYDGTSPYSSGYQIYPRSTRDLIDVIDDLSATQANQAVTLKWTDSSDPERCGYNIYWSSASQTTGYNTVISTYGIGIGSYTVNGLTNNATYWFYITLLQGGTIQPSQGESSPSTAVKMFPSVNPVVDITAPGAIATLSASNFTPNSSNVNAGKITLTWLAPYGDGTYGPAAASYVVKYATFGPITEANFDSMVTYSQSLAPKTPGLSETLTLAGLGHGVTYYFNIKSLDSFSNKASTSVAATTYSTPYIAETIANARIKPDGTTGVAIQGVITSLYNTAATYGFYMQDATGGIDFYSPVSALQGAGAVNLGDEYLIIGNLATYNGLKEITGVGNNYLRIGTGRAFSPVVVTCKQLADNGETYEGTLIKILNVTTTDSFPAAPGTRKNMTIKDATGSVVMTIGSQVDMGIYKAKTPAGPFNVTGNASQFTTTTGGYQIAPRGPSDIEGDVTPPVAIEKVTVTASKSGEGGIVMLWPASTDPADSLHGSTAVSKYKIKYSINPQSLYGAATAWWDAATDLSRVSPANLSNTVIGSTMAVSAIVPQQPGSIEDYVAMSPDVVLGTNYYFGIKAVDASGNDSSISYVTPWPVKMAVNGLKIGKTDLGDRMTIFSSGTYVTRRYVVNYGDADEGIPPTISADPGWVPAGVPISFVGYTSGRTGITPFSVKAAAVIVSSITKDFNGVAVVPAASNSNGGSDAFSLPLASNGSKYESIDIIATVNGYTYVVTRWNDISAPVAPDSTKITLTPRAPGSNDQDHVEGAPGTVEAFATVILYSKDPALLTTKALRDKYTVSKTTALADGSFPVTNAGFSQYSKIFVCAKDPAGNKSSAASVFLPVSETKFYQPGPNPFKLDDAGKARNNGRVTLWFDLIGARTVTVPVTIKIFNTAGEYITNMLWGPNGSKVAYDNLNVPAGGSNRISATGSVSQGFIDKLTDSSPQWDGKNDAGNDVASGVYIIYFKAGDYETTKKIVLIR